MLLFLFKQLSNVREAIVGRNEPAQLAWGVAFGVLLGIVPHGNLLAIALVILILSLRLNQGIATIAAVASTFLATRVDPYSHQVGRYVLTHEDLSRHVANAWQLPFVPWTDINDTIVIGSLVIGVAALVPIFLLTYPIFHLFAAKDTPIDGGSPVTIALAAGTERSEVSKANPNVQGPHFTIVAEEPFKPIVAPALRPSAIDAAMAGIGGSNLTSSMPSESRDAEPQLIETRIDVIRIGNRVDGNTGSAVEATDISKQDEPMSEALRYLLRQVRDANRRSAA